MCFGILNNEMCILFLIIDPNTGLIALEIKDLKLDTISKTDKNDFYLNNATIKNPEAQVRDYTLKIKNLLETKKELVQDNPKYRGKLKFCWSYSVIFANITRREFIDTSFSKSISMDKTLFKDDILKIKGKQNPDFLLGKLRNTYTASNRFTFPALSDEDMKLIGETLSGSSYSWNEEPVFLENQPKPQFAKKISIINPVILPNIFSFKSIKKYLVFTLIMLGIVFLGVNDYLHKENLSKFFINFVESLKIEKLSNAHAGSVENQVAMNFKVGSHPGAKGTYILIKDGKKTLISKIFKEGSIIEFYDNKKVIICDSTGDTKEFLIENDLVNLEVGNDYTRIYLNYEEYKYLKYFTYDFENNEIVRVRK